MLFSFLILNRTIMHRTSGIYIYIYTYIYIYIAAHKDRHVFPGWYSLYLPCISRVSHCSIYFLVTVTGRLGILIAYMYLDNLKQLLAQIVKNFSMEGERLFTYGLRVWVQQLKEQEKISTCSLCDHIPTCLSLYARITCCDQV